MVVVVGGFGLLVEFIAAWAAAISHLSQQNVVLARQDFYTKIRSTIFA
jgi:hypothetical protein